MLLPLTYSELFLIKDGFQSYKESNRIITYRFWSLVCLFSLSTRLECPNVAEDMQSPLASLSLASTPGAATVSTVSLVTL